MKIVTAAEMREIDRLTTEQYGVPSLALMENAGTAVADFARKHFEFNSVCVVCGKGNNGGDGFVAARKLQEAGKQVSVVVLAAGPQELRGDAAEMFKRLQVEPLWITKEESFQRAEVQQALRAELIIDAILGTGFKPPIKGVAARAVQAINSAQGVAVAIDLPSGTDADSNEPPENRSNFVHADAIVSFTAPKPALLFGNLTEGPIAIASIGSPEKIVAQVSTLHEDVLTATGFKSFSIPRQRDANKGDFGHVLVIGGSVGKSGAAAMAGISALRSGAGLVTVACPKSVQPVIAVSAPELMTEPLPETSEGTISLLALAGREQLMKGKSVVVIGPGISRNPETAEFVRDLVSVCSVSMVIDADGLNAFEGRAEEIRPDEAVDPFAIRVLTPHPGEMSRLAGIPTGQVQRNRVATAMKVAIETRACVVLKGHNTVIANLEGHVWINTTGNPGMAKGGSGDVLSGVIAGILAQAPTSQEMNTWQAEWRGESDLSDLPIPGVYRWISKNDPEAASIRELATQYRKTHDTKLLAEISNKMKEKTRQAI
ncbi:MAG TPA: NAD(P)H-hydrate dehydratase, partial [Terriglobales bacterium]|nr:NAD(P)H-hydrate dehydratase [Terriglobales bacterium]